MHEVAQQPNEQRSLEIDLFHLNGFESYYKLTQEKEWFTYFWVWSGMKYHSMSYWWIAMTSPVEFLTFEFHTQHVWKVL